MAKVAVIADTHWGVRNDSPVFLDYFRKCVDEFFLPIIDKQRVTEIIHLGDLVDRRKYVNFNTANRLRVDFLEKIEKRNIKTYVIGGNHDEYYKDTYVINALDELVSGRYKNIQCFTKPIQIDIDGCEILLLPWVTPDNMEKSIKAIKSTSATVCMGHLELEGFEFYKGQVAEHGTIDKGLLSGFDIVYSGHYHHRSTRGNIVYVGAFSEHIWSDYNDPRGFSIFDTETRRSTFYRNPHSIFHMVHYDDVTDTEILEKINSTDYSKYKDCYIKVVCANKTNPYVFDILLDKLHAAQVSDLSVVEDMNNIIDNKEDELIDEAQDTMSILDNYIQGLTLPVETDKMKNYMRDIYTEALSKETVE